MTVTIWTMVHGSPDAHECDEDDWIGMFYAFDESDGCAMDGVEIDGQWVDRDDVRRSPEYKAIEARQEAAWRASADANVAAVKVRHPVRTDSWAWYNSGPDDKIMQLAAEATERYGADRVSIWRRVPGKGWMERDHAPD